MATSDHVFNVPAFTPIGSHSTASPVAATVIARPASNVGGDEATLLALQPLDQAIRFTLDGTTPVAGTTGFLVDAGERVNIPVANNTTVTIIEEAAAPAANVQYQWGR